jgi:hypothetical protein
MYITQPIIEGTLEASTHVLSYQAGSQNYQEHYYASSSGLTIYERWYALDLLPHNNRSR